jgi:NADH-quinone oxidoreductase subunit A
MGYDLTNVLVFAVFSILFVVTAVSVLSRLLRPRSSPPGEPMKSETYECGEPPVGSSWVRFDIRFYTVALIFIIFDVEVDFLYPWGVVFEDLRKAGLGFFVFLEMSVFVAILVVGFAYCWRKGDLDWVKSSEGQRAWSAEAVLSGTAVQGTAAVLPGTAVQGTAAVLPGTAVSSSSGSSSP